MIDPKIIFSLAIIGHNEKKHLQFLLPDVMNFADEIIYVDCESEDQSYEYAKSLGCKVFRRPNNTNLNVNELILFEALSCFSSSLRLSK